MKKIVSLICFSLINSVANSQSLYPTADSLDINNLKAYVFLHGDIWGLTDTVLSYPGKMGTQYPRNSRKHITQFGSLWICAYDQNNQLHTSAASYRSYGVDFWPGPLDSSGNTNMATIDKWARTWKVYQAQIDTFMAIANHTVNNTPTSILEWPAKGNPYAKGRNAIALAINETMAPFADINNNGLYDPLSGDYPLIKGDVMIWWVINDNGPTHAVSNGTPLKVNVQNAAYAFSRGTDIDNVVFQEFHVVNRSANNYDSVRIGLHTDFDLGYAYDDYIGFDSAYRIGYVYNGNTLDGVLSDSCYYDQVPIAGICMLDAPGDNLPLKQPVGACIYYNNDNSSFGNPVSASDFNNYLHARSRTSGYYFTNDYHGPGIPSSATTSGPNTDYVFSGDPADTSQWSECSAQNPVGDRRLVLGTRDFTLNAGMSETLSMALIVSDTNTGNACPTINIHSLEILADSAQYFYRSALSTLKVTKNFVNLKIYPNPASDKVTIEIGNLEGDITVLNLLGEYITLQKTQKSGNIQLDISTLPNSIYTIIFRNSQVFKTALFIKQ